MVKIALQYCVRIDTCISPDGNTSNGNTTNFIQGTGPCKGKRLALFGSILHGFGDNRKVTFFNFKVMWSKILIFPKFVINLE